MTNDLMIKYYLLGIFQHVFKPVAKPGIYKWVGT